MRSSSSSSCNNSGSHNSTHLTVLQLFWHAPQLACSAVILVSCWVGTKCMQISLDVQHCMSATNISCVCMYGNHCNLEGCTCVNFCVSWLPVTACRLSFLVTEHCSPDQHFSLSLVTASNCAPRYVVAPICHQSFAQNILQTSLRTCCKEPCINACKLCSCGMACKY